MIASCTIPGTPQQQGSKAPWGVDGSGLRSGVEFVADSEVTA